VKLKFKSFIETTEFFEAKKDLANSFEQIKIMDTRRNLNSKKIFKDLYGNR
jgi:hypothetical protein